MVSQEHLFAPLITPEYMSQSDSLTYVANDAFLAQADVFRDWTIKIFFFFFFFFF